MAYYFSYLAPFDSIKDIYNIKELKIKYPNYIYKNIVSNYCKKPIKDIKWKWKNGKIRINGKIMLNYYRIINLNYVEYTLINFKKLIQKKVSISLSDPYTDELGCIYFIAKNNKLFTSNSYDKSIIIYFYSINNFHNLIHTNSNIRHLFSKYKKQGRLKWIKYEDNMGEKVFLYFYKEYKIYIQEKILYFYIHNVYKYDYKNVYKQYYIFI